MMLKSTTKTHDLKRDNNRSRKSVALKHKGRCRCISLYV